MRITIALLCVCLVTLRAIGKENSSQVNDKINWESFLAKHDLIWDVAPDDYFTAPFLGNGLLGAMFYCEDAEKIRFDIGRTDVVEHRNSEANSIVDNGRLPIGYFTLEMNENFAGAKGRLNLFNAEANFNIQTDKKKNIRFRALVFKNFDAVLIEYDKPEELQCEWMFHPEASQVYRNPKVGSSYLNPIPKMVKVDGINICTQKRDAGGSYTTAWKITKSSENKFRVFITIQDSYPGNQSVERAIQNIKQISQSGECERNIESHKKWWNNYYTKSFISIPHSKMESVYWIQQYKFVSMMRKDATLCDLMGPWYKKTVWPGIWWNLNTQMLYSSLHISNQLELAATLPDFLVKNTNKLIAAVPENWQYNSAGVSRCTGPAMEESILTWPSPDSPERSNLTYLCYYLWEYYRVTMDNKYLHDHFFPLLKRSVNLILHEVSKDKSGIVHTPYGHSPESTEDVDTNYDLSSLKWGCQTLLKINEQLDIKDTLASKWQDVVNNLFPFPADKNGYMCSANQSAPLMHRHWCHLFQIYPYYLVTWEQPEHRENIINSIKYWGSPEIPNTWTQCVISSMYSSVGNSDEALKHMNLALASPNFYPNTFHAEGRNPCSETYGGLCRMLQDMLIQSWGDKIRIFPGVSDSWNDVVFHKLRAEGGFEVSAKRENGKTVWIRIKNNAGGKCRIVPHFAEKFKISGAKIKKLDNETYELNIKKGEEAFLSTNENLYFEVTPIENNTGEFNFYGLRTNSKYNQ